MAQDSALNNLVHPPGTRTAAWGTLGGVVTAGTGTRPMILIPGLGFSGGVFDEFMARHAADFRMYAVTLPGFGGTDPLPMPDSTSYVLQPWMHSAEQGILALMDREGIRRATLVAHWALGTQLALRLALLHPDRFEAVVLIAGVARAYYSNSPAMLTWTAAQRATAIDRLGSGWFRTVTRTTWDDNNYMSYDYALNPRRGLFLWREAARPALPVWIRYLLEFYAVDLTPDLPRLRVPVLVIQPGLDDPGYYAEKDRDYMRDLLLGSWQGVPRDQPMLQFVTIPGSRLFIQYDQPDALDRALAGFLARATPNR
jgi:pimeloyl-ACP methyl ester carboxylesterase